MKDLMDMKSLPKLGQESRKKNGSWWLKERNPKNLNKNVYYPQNMPVGRPSKNTVRSIRRKSRKMVRDYWNEHDSGYRATGNNQGVGF